MASFHYQSGRVNFSNLRELGRKELTEYLDKYSGTKALVWDEALTGPLGLIAEFTFLKERQVVKMFPLKSGRLPPSQVENIIFITRPEIKFMDYIADNVKGEELQGSGSGVRTEFHILFVPQKSLLCEMRLKDRGVYGSFTFLDELAIHWFPLDSDVISMENLTFFCDYHLNQDPTVITSVAKAMMALQAAFGVVPKVYGKGKAAKQLFDFMSRMRKEMMGEEPAFTPTIDQIVVIDRQVDLLSPLATQLTYEGLIDELFTINNTIVKLPMEKFITPDQSLDQTAGDEKKIVLTSAEEMFAELRDKNFNAIGPTLSKKAKAVSAQFEERHGAKSVRELKSFVERLPQMQAMKQSLQIHTSIAELIKEWTDTSQFLEFLQIEQELMNYQNTDRYLESIEDAACQEVDLSKVIRLMCMQSIVNSGLKPKVLAAYHKLVLQSYGYGHLLSLINLEKSGLLSLQQSSRNYAVLRKRLNLTQDDVNEQRPTDIAYVHSVYAPLSIRLVQQLSSPAGWRGIRDVLDLLPGPTVDEIQQSLVPRKRTRNEEGPKVTLVLFLGGCTFAEISALRFLSQQEDAPTEYLIATTSIINGKRFTDQLMMHLDDPTL